VIAELPMVLWPPMLELTVMLLGAMKDELMVFLITPLTVYCQQGLLAAGQTAAPVLLAITLMVCGPEAMVKLPFEA
jgi:hypothetical protein